jgi:hypothetical protein
MSRLTPAADRTGGTDETAILDHASAPVRGLVDQLDRLALQSETHFVRLAHTAINEAVRPVYAMNDLQPASETVRRGRGSCSQRLGLLEAVARGAGISTRVRGFVVDGRFWNPRFPRLRGITPDRVLLAWPEFLLDGHWVSATDLFEQQQPDTEPFTNEGSETLFGAISRMRIEWDRCTGGSVCDLSGWVLKDLGRFDSRDAFFEAHGQTLCLVARVAADPIMSRWSAGSSSDE